MFEISNASIRCGGAAKPSACGQLDHIRGLLDVAGKRVGNPFEFFRAARRGFEVAKHVADPGGFFKVLRRSGFFHFRFQLLLHFAALAFEKFARGRDLLYILFARDIAHTRGGAVFQVRVEAVFVIGFARSKGTATAQVKLPPHQGHRVAQRARVREGPEISRAVVLFEPREGKVRDGVVQVHLEHQMPFIVTETDVVTRLEFLDQFAFQQQRLGFAADQVKIEIANRLSQGVELEVPAHAAGGMKILGDALAQIARFAHVDDRAKPVAHQIDARFVRQRANLFSKEFGHNQTFYPKMRKAK